MKTEKKLSILSCAPLTAFLVFLFIGSAFTLIGCAQFYKTIGLTEQQAADQTAKDQESRQKIIERTRIDITQLATTVIAGLGTIASGFLAKWLGNERKITASLITGIESAQDTTAKKAVQQKATSAGVEHLLNKRVIALT